MLDCTTVQKCLPSLAAAFCLPPEDPGHPAWIERIIAGGEYATRRIFPHVREALAHGSDAYDPLEMESLRGVVGTGITLLEATANFVEEKSVDAAPRTKLRFLLEEYQKLFEDIELFSGDISSADCLLATSNGILRHELESAEENAVWRDL